MKVKLMFLLNSVLILSLSAPWVYASEGGGSSHPLVDFVFKILNFAVLIYVLYRFARNPVKAGMHSSAETAKQNLDDARAAKQQIAEDLKHYQNKLANMKKEAEAMIANAKKEAEAEKNRIIGEGHAISEKIRVQTQMSVEQEYKKAEQALKAWVAEEAMKLAEKKIKQQLTDAHQSNLVSRYISELTQSGGTQ
ncbi:F0F1 ATP synthase subunit B [Deltaproteobacteria bacterium TL4]